MSTYFSSRVAVHETVKVSPPYIDTCVQMLCFKSKPTEQWCSLSLCTNKPQTYTSSVVLWGKIYTEKVKFLIECKL